MEEGVGGGHSGPLEGLAEGVQNFQLMTPYGFSFVKMKVIDLDEISILVVVSSPSEVGKSFKIAQK